MFKILDHKFDANYEYALIYKEEGKIDKALDRIKNKTYGFCEDTGEPIGLKRLIARPIAILSIEAQERHENKEKIFADN